MNIKIHLTSEEVMLAVTEYAYNHSGLRGEYTSSGFISVALGGGLAGTITGAEVDFDVKRLASPPQGEARLNSKNSFHCAEGSEPPRMGCQGYPSPRIAFNLCTTHKESPT